MNKAPTRRSINAALALGALALPRLGIGLNGLQIGEKILSVYPRLPIVLHTIHLFPAMTDEARKAGIREVVGKEVTAERLLDVIETLLKQNRSGTAKTSRGRAEKPDADTDNGKDTPPVLN